MVDISGLTSDEAYSLARDRETPPEALTVLLRSVHERVRTAAAWNPSTPVSALLDVLKWGDVNLRTTVVGNKGLPLVEALKIAFDDEEVVLQRFAYRKDLPPEVMIRLASHNNVVIVAGVGRNPSMPFEAGLVAVKGKSALSLTTIFGHQKFPFPAFVSWLESKSVDLSAFETPNSFPFQFLVDWLRECEDSWLSYNSFEYVLEKRFGDVRGYVEQQTGVAGLPDAWVVKTFKMLLGAS